MLAILYDSLLHNLNIYEEGQGYAYVGIVTSLVLRSVEGRKIISSRKCETVPHTI